MIRVGTRMRIAIAIGIGKKMMMRPLTLTPIATRLTSDIYHSFSSDKGAQGKANTDRHVIEVTKQQLLMMRQFMEGNTSLLVSEQQELDPQLATTLKLLTLNSPQQFLPFFKLQSDLTLKLVLLLKYLAVGGTVSPSSSTLQQHGYKLMVQVMTRCKQLSEQEAEKVLREVYRVLEQEQQLGKEHRQQILGSAPPLLLHSTNTDMETTTNTTTTNTGLICLLMQLYPGHLPIILSHYTRMESGDVLHSVKECMYIYLQIIKTGMEKGYMHYYMERVVEGLQEEVTQQQGTGVMMQLVANLPLWHVIDPSIIQSLSQMGIQGVEVLYTLAINLQIYLNQQQHRQENTLAAASRLLDAMVESITNAGPDAEVQYKQYLMLWKTVIVIYKMGNINNIKNNINTISQYLLPQQPVLQQCTAEDLLHIIVAYRLSVTQDKGQAVSRLVYKYVEVITGKEGGQEGGQEGGVSSREVVTVCRVADYYGIKLGAKMEGVLKELYYGDRTGVDANILAYIKNKLSL